MTQAIITRNNKDLVSGWMAKNREALIRAFPSTIDVDRFIRTVSGAIARDDKLQRCSWTSLMGAVIQSGLIGLEPNSPLGEAYLIPYGEKVQLQISYRGRCTLAIRSGYVATIEADVVYEADDFDWQRGTNSFIRHKRSLADKRGAFVCVWARVVMTNGQERFEIMSPADIEHVKKSSRAAEKKGSIWEKHPDEMRKKSVVIRITKMVPMSAEAAAADHIEVQQDTHGKIDYRDAIDIVGVPVVDPEDSETGAPGTAVGAKSDSIGELPLTPPKGSKPSGAVTGGAR